MAPPQGPELGASKYGLFYEEALEEMQGLCLSWFFVLLVGL